MSAFGLLAMTPHQITADAYLVRGKHFLIDPFDKLRVTKTGDCRAAFRQVSIASQ